MVKKLAKFQNQIKDACPADIKAEWNWKIKTEQPEFGAAAINKVFKINQKRSSPIFESKFQPKDEKVIKEEKKVAKTQFKEEIIGLEDLLEAV